MNDIDKILVIVALALGILDVANVSGPFSRYHLRGWASSSLPSSRFTQGHVLNFQ
jgi:hypothetical protein